MFFQPHEKQVYSPEGCDKKYDPLALDRALTQLSRGSLNELLELWAPEEEGDVSPESKKEATIASAEAEGKLAAIARKAFELPPFPECMDATALEYLRDFLLWMMGKGERAAMQQ